MDEESRQSERFDFDGFWKDLIERFWRELLKSLLPTLYAVADLTKEPVFLDKELRDVLHISDDQDSPRFVDVLLKIPLKDGGEEWVLLHIEVQGKGCDDISYRMALYCCLIFSHHYRMPVALAILTAPRPEKEPLGIYTEEQCGTQLTYRYNCFEIMNQDDGALLGSDNPFDLIIYAAKKESLFNLKVV